MNPSHPPSPPARARPGRAARTAAYLRLCGLAPPDAGRLADCSIDEVQARLDAWARGLVPAQPGESALQQAARGRAQLLLARVPARWPAQFLGSAPPPELAAAVRAVTLEPKRPLRQAAMVPQDLDLGPVSDVAEETWKTFDTWPVLRGLTLWLLFSLLLASVFIVVRF